MGAPKLLALLLLPLLFAAAFAIHSAEAEADVDGGAAELHELTQPEEAAAKDSWLKAELEQLRSKISLLESKVEDSTRELKSKDEAIAQIDKIIQEKSDTVNLLQSEIDLIQKRSALDSAEMVEKAQARALALEKQMEKLISELQTQSQKKDDLEARAVKADNFFDELSIKLKTLQNTNAEQKQRIQKLERVLKVSEEELLKAKLEVASKKKRLKEVHGSWLPPWLATHLHILQEYTASQWNQHGRPALGAFMEKVSAVSVQAQKHVEPHLTTIRDKWMPTIKEQWMSFVVLLEPHVQLISSKSFEFYETSVNTLKPHVVRAQELAQPYFQDFKKFSKPYVDEVARFTKPHVEKMRVFFKPYTKKVSRVYRKFLKSATSYHQQVQAATHEQLKKYELTRAFATKELVWFLASAFFAVPLYLLIVLFASSFGKKTKKSARSLHGNHTHRKHKRRHPENKIEGRVKM